MKLPARQLIILLLFAVSQFSCSRKSGWAKDKARPAHTTDVLPKKIRKELAKNFVLVEGGSFTSGLAMGRDTFYLLVTEKRYTLSDFYMDRYEVTVADFMQFCYETGDTANKPDTVCFVRDFEYAYNEPLCRVYFWHPKYRNYPVCGVTLEQAQHYCQWKTDKLNRQLKQTRGYENVEVAFRLPTATELEYAITYNEGAGETEFESPYKRYTGLENFKNTNTSGVVDVNNVPFVSWSADGFFYPAPVKSYKPNDAGLYNIQGNVAEWTQSPVNSYYEPDTTRWNWLMAHYHRLEDGKKAAAPRGETYTATNRRQVNTDTSFEQLRAYRLYHDTGYYITKGGSWAHGPFYIQGGAFIPVKKNESYSWLGFRLVLMIVKQDNGNSK